MRSAKIAPTKYSRGALLLGLAALGAAGYHALGLPEARSQSRGPAAAPETVWAAAAPGQVEPRGGEIRIAAPVPGVIKEVPAGLNGRVRAGDLLILLDDADLKAKLAAARSIAALRLAERDAIEVRGPALERRKAEDALYEAERNLLGARLELDRLLGEERLNKASVAEVEAARQAVLSAETRLEAERAALAKVQGEKLPALTKEEAALDAARAEVAAVCAALERMRIRAPRDATVLELAAKVGETAVVGSPLAVLGDISHLQVRAEVEERDVPKVFIGQSAVAKSGAFSGRSFDARVSQIAKALGAPKLTSKGQRKQTDVQVLEVVLDLDDGLPLLPGMRLDVLFRAPQASSKGEG